MSNECYFSNIELKDGEPVFLFVGELKAYGLNHFVKTALQNVGKKTLTAVSIAPDMIDPSSFVATAMLPPLVEKMNGKVVCRRTSMVDFSKFISDNEWIKTFLSSVFERQNELFVWMFESKNELEWLSAPNVTLLGPDPKLTHSLNDKCWQYGHLGQIVPVVDHYICKDREEMVAKLAELAPSADNKVFVSASYSAGGVSSMVCTDANQARERFANVEGRFLMSRYLPHEYDPTVLAVVGSESDVYVAGVADMNIEGGNMFRGSTFPSILPSEIQARLREYTAAVGRELGRLGFRGIFGCDYIVTSDGDIRFIEVNPRKQGTTMEFCCALERLLPVGAPSLFDLEVHAILKGGFPAEVHVPDYDKIIDGGLHWGTYNFKTDKYVLSGEYLPQDIAERDLFKQVAEEGGGGSVILEHAGSDVVIAPGTFVGRVAAVGEDREIMQMQLAQAKDRLLKSVKDYS